DLGRGHLEAPTCAGICRCASAAPFIEGAKTVGSAGPNYAAGNAPTSRAIHMKRQLCTPRPDRVTPVATMSLQLLQDAVDRFRGVVTARRGRSSTSIDPEFEGPLWTLVRRQPPVPATRPA